MKILLIYPPTGETGVLNMMSATYPPQGLLMIASVLENAGHQVSVIDCNVETVSFNEIGERISAFKPEITGISVLSSMRFSAFKIAALQKSINKNCMVVAGGQHVTFLDEITLRKVEDIDVIVRGEGEQTILDLIEKPLSEIDGITYRSNGRITRNPDRRRIEDLDVLPLPAYHLLPMEKYFHNLKEYNPFHYSYPATAIMTSRGCVNKCSFCSSTQTWKILKMHSPDYVVKNIELLIRNYGIRDFIIYDDVFPITYKWLKEFADILSGKNIKISFQCLSRVTSMTEEIVKLLAETGCYMIDFGLESGSERVLNSVDKRTTILQAIKAVELCRKRNITVRACFMLGFPEETLEDMFLTLKLIQRIPLSDFCISQVLVYPGSRMAEGLKTDNDIWFDRDFRNAVDYSQPNIPLAKNKYFGPEEIAGIANYIIQEGFYANFLRKLKFDIIVSGRIIKGIKNNFKAYLIRAGKINKNYFAEFDYTGHRFLNGTFRTIYGLLNAIRTKIR